MEDSDGQSVSVSRYSWPRFPLALMVKCIILKESASMKHLTSIREFSAREALGFHRGSHSQDQKQQRDLGGERQPVDGTRCCVYRGVVKLGVEDTTEQRHCVVADREEGEHFSCKQPGNLQNVPRGTCFISILPRSSTGTSFDVIDLKTGATTGPNAATAAPGNFYIIFDTRGGKKKVSEVSLFKYGLITNVK